MAENSRISVNELYSFIRALNEICESHGVDLDIVATDTYGYDQYIGILNRETGKEIATIKSVEGYFVFHTMKED